MTPERLAEMERQLVERFERDYSTSYETSGFYVMSRSSVDDLIEHAIAFTVAALDAAEQRAAAAEAFVSRLVTWMAGLDLEDDEDGYGPETP